MSKTLIAQPETATVSRPDCPYSVFHSEWWLDAATGGRWNKCEVRRDGKVVGSWPYLIKRRMGLNISMPPALTRSLGPVVLPGKGKAVAEFRREAEVVGELVQQLPHVHYFSQTLDPKSRLGIHLRTSGFTCGLDYTIRTVAGQSSESLWNEMRDKTRNLIRSAVNSGVSVTEINDPDEFCAFFAGRLEARNVTNVYSPEVMRQICRAAIQQNAGKALGAYSSSGALVAAIFTVWDAETSYYLLSCRQPEAHNGAVSQLLWQGMQEAAAAGRAFDFDGTPTPAIVRFLSGFCANVIPRVQIVRGGSMMRMAHTMSRRMASRSMFRGGGTDVSIPE